MRHVTVNHSFRVDDDVSDAAVAAIVGGMTVQVTEAVTGWDENGNEQEVATYNVDVSHNIVDCMTVWAVSFVHWDDAESGGGGFWWYWNKDTALAGFEEEKAAWRGGTARIRLVEVEVPTKIFGNIGGIDSEENGAVTDYLDGMIDDLEKYLPATKVALICDERRGG